MMIRIEIDLDVPGSNDDAVTLDGTRYSRMPVGEVAAAAATLSAAVHGSILRRIEIVEDES